jgi:hypothetical protein
MGHLETDGPSRDHGELSTPVPVLGTSVPVPGGTAGTDVLNSPWFRDVQSMFARNYVEKVLCRSTCSLMVHRAARVSVVGSAWARRWIWMRNFTISNGDDIQAATEPATVEHASTYGMGNLLRSQQND